ncbi:MAG: hypothetical protein U1F67_01355 [Rubrivivax sp.]
MNTVYRKGAILPALLAMAVFGRVPAAHAVPSFARQTNMACEACHTVYPELTHFGRVFKANGYTLDNLKPVRGITATRSEMLDLTGLPPISLMVQVSETWLNKAVPDGTGLGVAQNGTVAFPQQISIFYAGKIAPRVGAFIQLTYGNDSGTIGIDNVDLRYANALVLPQDPGRYARSGKEADRNQWRVPSLRNLAYTAPYLHNGSVDTLENAVRVLASTELGLVLTDAQVADLSAFLQALSGPLPVEPELALPR